MDQSDEPPSTALDTGAPLAARPSANSDDRILRARMAAHLLHAQIADPSAHTAPARAAFLSRFEREVDPDGVLEPQERARRAEHAKKAYFLWLALASRKARAAKRRRSTKPEVDDRAGIDQDDQS
jgi:hypothetical protein